MSTGGSPAPELCVTECVQTFCYICRGKLITPPHEKISHPAFLLEQYVTLTPKVNVQ